MQKYDCPSCGAEITFQSSISVSCVCAYCRSLVVRHDTNVDAIGKMAELPRDISPFQLGTSGVYKNIPFTLIGRLKRAWSDGYWNEWFMLTDTGKKGWLAEAQGFLAISFEEEMYEEERQANKRIKFLKPMSARMIRNKHYTVVDIKEAECIGSEGELPFAICQGIKTKSVDLLGSDGEFASFEYAEDIPPKFFTGEYVEFNQLRFSNLRPLPGWDVVRQPHPIKIQKVP